jgi:putative tryptophan/tyrosine transport system substrate-binding protein
MMLFLIRGAMRRREFIGLIGSAVTAGSVGARAQQATATIGFLSSRSPARGAAAWPVVAWAQQPAMPVVGSLATANPRTAPQNQAFEQRLRELGYIDGRNIAFDYRNAERQVDKLAGFAGELVRLRVNVIVAPTDPATRAAMAATATIPIVTVAINYDPVALGYIDSIGRPGANVTGLYFQHLGLLAKRFGLFLEMLPIVGRVAILTDSLTADQLEEVEAVNRAVGLDLQPLVLENPPYDFEGAFRIATSARAQAMFVLESASMFRGRAQIAQLAIKNRLPTSFAFRDYVVAGGLVSYGVNLSTMYRRAAEYVDKILRGAKAADLPVEQPTKFELAINLKTAKALGLDIPPSLLARADEVIE